jgi:hypothetical protein
VPFIKIAFSFISLIPSLIPPTDDRETTERRAKRYHALAAKNSALFLRLSPKEVDSLPEKVVFIPKKVDFFPKTVYLSVLKKKSPQKAFSLAHLKISHYLCKRKQRYKIWQYVKSILMILRFR